MKKLETLGRILSKKEQSRIVGGITPDCYDAACLGGEGGSSCWHTADWTDYDCSLNQAQAQQMQQSQGGLWCTSSCCISCHPQE